MRKFYLKLKKSRETIQFIIAPTFEDALDFFCKRKRLEPKELLKIFVITE